MAPGALRLGAIDTFLLEDWFRERYFTATIDISSSGVADYTLGELRRLLGIDTDELDQVVFRDSPSVGGERLRVAITDRFLPPGAAQQVMVTNGSTEALFLALAAVIEPGDEVVVLGPAYQSYASVAAAVGARVRVWPLRPEAGFEPDPADLRAVVGAATRAIVVNFPHNPTGAVASAECYRQMLEIADAADCLLFCDDALTELAYDRDGPPRAAHTGHPRCVSFGTMSKAYGLPGLRVGWCLAPPELVQRMVRLRDHVSIGTSALNELLAARVLERADLVVAPRRAQAAHNRTRLGDWAAQRPDEVVLSPPAGGVTAFPRFPRVPDVFATCEELAREHGVLVVPGNCFGHPDRMRIGFGGPTADLVKGLDLITFVLNSYSTTGNQTKEKSI